ncbi:tRNA (5-methylaminomethyl-2-thiouridine)(34)-methyltransferase MnmD [Ancylomarina longa]|uniref:SAM-dependent methyltransferase n=1 Tax=Ancylomarina longa TaxID=2487017 RepID=A0A434AFF0_9BACT|nr:tRNA (5-methylaminomethyl-2-thiouridine)(34)-methyltransferase MnmD [Ancylomarina longa]RUT73072.1 SAM-dependent methyltransferase [Ancylomarina longa]
MKKLKRELKTTEDGSHTFYMPELGEHYHSTHGAIQEAIHVYINAGFNYSDKDPIHILEIGFGTGLNCFLTLIEAMKQKRKVNYHSIELYPLEQKEVEKLNYAAQANQEYEKYFAAIHKADWDKTVEISSNFYLKKIKGDLLEYAFTDHYDLLYFDAFAPDIQPKLWTKDVFDKLYQSTKSNAILTTYSTKGIVKQALRAAGFEVKRLPGPPGKHQMLRATRISKE